MPQEDGKLKKFTGSRQKQNIKYFSVATKKEIRQIELDWIEPGIQHLPFIQCIMTLYSACKQR